jgi:FkbM family methyltransferase
MLDIGAGVGTEIKAFSDWVGPQGLVYAVEADPSAFSRLEKLIDLLQLQNVTALHLAIGATEGLARLTQDGADGLVNRVVADAESSTVAIPMASLDTLISDLGLEQIDYLKMNIEGAERQALIGFQERSATVKNWCISCHDFLDIPGTETMEFVVDWLQQRGMSTSRHPDVPDSPWVKFYVYAAQGD